MATKTENKRLFTLLRNRVNEHFSGTFHFDWHKAQAKHKAALQAAVKKATRADLERMALGENVDLGVKSAHDQQNDDFAKHGADRKALLAKIDAAEINAFLGDDKALKALVDEITKVLATTP